MHGQSESRDRVEHYLLRFRLGLRGTSKAERSEIVSDIRCHIAERVKESALPDEQAINQTLDALGSPESLAETYRLEGLLNRAVVGVSPSVLIRATFAWALAGIEGFFALLFLFTGYATALSFLACAVLKPFFPEQVGVWVGPSLFAFGIRFPAQDTSRELLGWWIVPVAFVLGIGVFVLTTKLGRFFLRRFRNKLGSVHMGALPRTALLFVLASIVLHAQGLSPAGKWSGVLDAGSQKLHIGLDITSASGNAFKGSMSVLEQGVSALPIDTITVTDGHVIFSIARIGGSYDGRLKNDHMEGYWSQGGHKIPLNFERGTKTTSVLRRPQNPLPPFPYNSEEVTVKNGNIMLAGTFTYPKSGGPFPGLLLVTGSGPEDRDETVFGHKPFLVLSDYLTRAGFAVLRLDDRGTGKSTGTFGAAGLTDFTNDVLAATSWLKQCKAVEATKIGLIGHSEGGAVAPLAAIRSQDIAFIVLMAGPGVPFDQLMYRQEADLMRAEGASEQVIAENHALMERVFQILREESDNTKATERLNALVAETKTHSPELASALQQQSRGMVQPEFRSLLRYNPAETLSKVKCPVLAIDGAKDLQVAADQNLPGIAAALAAGHNSDFTVAVLPGLNHLFQQAKNGGPAEYAITEETISPRALNVVREWLLAHASPI